MEAYYKDIAPEDRVLDKAGNVVSRQNLSRAIVLPKDKKRAMEIIKKTIGGEPDALQSSTSGYSLNATKGEKTFAFENPAALDFSEYTTPAADEPFDFSLPPEIQNATEPEGLMDDDFDEKVSPDLARQSEPAPTLEDNLAAAIRSNDTDKAMDVIKTILGREEIVQRFKPDRSPEAMTADLVQAANEERQGRAPSMALTRSGRFGGETRSPEEIERAGQKDVYGMLSDYSRQAGAEADAKFKADRLSLMADRQAQNVLEFGEKIRAFNQQMRQKGKEVDARAQKVRMDSLFNSYENAMGSLNNTIDSYKQLASTMTSKERKESGILKLAAEQVARQKKLVDKILKEQGYNLDE